MAVTNKVDISNREDTINKLTEATSSKGATINNSNSMGNSKEVMVKILDTEALLKHSNINKINTSRGHHKEAMELLHPWLRKHRSGNLRLLPTVMKSKSISDGTPPKASRSAWSKCPSGDPTA